MARLVVGPCSQEARGLDAGPRLVERLMSVGDFTSAAIVHQISKEEMAHVAVGERDLARSTASHRPIRLAKDIAERAQACLLGFLRCLNCDEIAKGCLQFSMPVGKIDK